MAKASDLERRKSLRITLRTDLAIDAQRYEGKTFYVVKDPMSLRYYRLKDYEHFLLKFLDGKHTLEEAQKAYEKEYRPDRLPLEDLEAFAQQLMTAGLAHNESPAAGEQLFQRRKKRKRQEWLQTFTNILYIKIPIFDPDRILVGMLRYLGWIFSAWFFTVSVGIMLAAILLVATHFDTFRSKLPDYHEFFSFKTAVYLWISLGVVKIIHEFGHGLSCKRFGGEVHEMGFLLMCFSPALYCNVSDAWVLPNKWHRIIISSAGIYVELIIAAIATFVWWNTPTQPFTNNLALSLMVVCSVSTVVFNANPLMRYDGYYVLADWLEIPNLREKSNRFLQNLVLDKCLGIEVQPEPYMQLGRKVLFVVYAIVSYIYRWVVTFSILYFFYMWLRPYKLEVISNLLTLAAVASMTIWPTYRLIRAIHRRGRLPDMKRWRVMVSSSVVVGAILFVCLVPIPISRVRGLALVQPHSDNLGQVVVKRSGFLQELKVQPGDFVRKDNVLAVFRDPKLEDELAAENTEWENSKTQVQVLTDQRTRTTDSKELARLDKEIAEATAKEGTARVKVRALEQTRARDLVLHAPRDGVIGQSPRLDEVGKFFEAAPQEQGQGSGTGPLFTIIEPGRLRLCMPVPTSEFNQLRENLTQLEIDRRRRPGAEQSLGVTLRIHGRGSSTWKGRISRLDLSEVKYVPLPLSSKAGGPIPVKAQPGRGGLVPQTQYYFVYIDILDPDGSIHPGAMGQAKIHCRPETCLSWLWRKVNNTFNLRLL
jgi:putative peptide zinc metalloprotease protein